MDCWGALALDCPTVAPNTINTNNTTTTTTLARRHPHGVQYREAVALVGAHTIGRCHTDRSGFWGPWTNAPTTFSNLYFQELMNNKWCVWRAREGGQGGLGWVWAVAP